MNPTRQIVDGNVFVPRAVDSDTLLERALRYEFERLNSTIPVIRLANIQQELVVLDAIQPNYEINLTGTASRTYRILVMPTADTSIKFPSGTIFNNNPMISIVQIKAGKLMLFKLTIFRSNVEEAQLIVETTTEAGIIEDLSGRVEALEARNVYTDEDKANVGRLPYLQETVAKMYHDLHGTVVDEQGKREGGIIEKLEITAGIVDDHSTRLSLLEDEVETHSSRIDTIEDDVQNLQEEVVVIDERLAALEDGGVSNEIQEQLDALITMISSQGNRVSANETAIEDLRDNLASTKNELQLNIDNSIETVLNSITELENNVTNIVNNFEGGEADLSDIRNTLSDLNSTLIQHNEVIHTWKPTVEAVPAMNEALGNLTADVYGGMRPDNAIGANIMGTISDWNKAYFAPDALIDRWNELIFNVNFPAIFGTSKDSTTIDPTSHAGRIATLEAGRDSGEFGVPLSKFAIQGGHVRHTVVTSVAMSLPDPKKLTMTHFISFLDDKGPPTQSSQFTFEVGSGLKLVPTLDASNRPTGIRIELEKGVGGDGSYDGPAIIQTDVGGTPALEFVF